MRRRPPVIAAREDRRTREDRALAEDAREDATLDAYVEKISALILDRGLLEASPGSAVRQLASTTTLATVRRLSGSRKGEVVRFLYEAGLLDVPLPYGVEPVAPIISLSGADLRGADLVKASLNERRPTSPHPSQHGIALWGSDLRGARFDHAYLDGVNLVGANLRGASFKGARIYNTSFAGARLGDASFEGAYINENVRLNSTDLSNAVFDSAIIAGGTTFYHSLLDDASFVHAVFDKRRRSKFTTSLRCAQGRGVDFSHAVNLSSLNVQWSDFTDVRMDGVERRPHGWGSKGTLHPEEGYCWGGNIR
jgi:uncharacterized protein YjbI with pentapeptide repeats